MLERGSTQPVLLKSSWKDVVGKRIILKPAGERFEYQFYNTSYTWVVSMSSMLAGFPGDIQGWCMFRTELKILTDR